MSKFTIILIIFIAWMRANAWLSRSVFGTQFWKRNFGNKIVGAYGKVTDNLVGGKSFAGVFIENSSVPSSRTNASSLLNASKVFITLTPSEEQLFEIFKRASEKHNTTLRVAGGWVRDKLIHAKCEDIDIAVDNISGEQMAIVIVNYLNKNHPCYSKGNAVIPQVNPENSKHLETAIIQVQNIEFNFVQLRSDVYSSNSRIPKVACASPFTDAHRRDLTINSLFYNINNDTIEDFTGKGILHLQQQIISTPLSPLETLVDDPLRALRVVRFAVRLGFNIEDTLWNAIKSPAIQEMLSRKVSRPRIGVEIQAMLSEPHLKPIRALKLLLESGLHLIVFGVLNSQAGFEKRIVKCAVAANELSKHSFCSLERVIWFCALFIIDETCCNENIIFVHKIAHAMFAMSLGIKHSLINRTLNTLNQTYQIFKLIEKASSAMGGDSAKKFTEALQDDHYKLSVGLWLRNNSSNWKSLVSLSSIWRTNCNAHGDVCESCDPESLANSSEFIAAIESHSLDQICHLKLDFSGRDLKSMFLLKDGPIIGKLLNELLIWKILNIHATREQAKLHLQKKLFV